MEKKLYRIMAGKKIAGVCTGIADYFKLDVTVIRLVWVLWVLFAGMGLLAYIIAALLIPEEPQDAQMNTETTDEQ